MKNQYPMHTLRWCLLLWLVSGETIQSQEYLTAVAKPGDGAISLLRYFQCYTKCNLDHFYQINRISRNRGLIADRVYQLPILVYEYNGRSIRTTIGINDYPRAKRIQMYNEAVHKSQLQSKDYRDGKILWVPYHFITCPEERAEAQISTVADRPINTGSNQKPIGVRGTYSIFGSKYATVPLLDNQLKGRVFYIVAGHGGPDPGASGRRWGKTITEDEYAYDVALRLTRNLLMHGATVYVIVRDPNDGIRNGEYLRPDKDEVVWGDLPIPRGQKERLQQRADIINALYQKNQQNGVTYQRLITIHIDSRYMGKRIDMFFYHREDDDDSKALTETVYTTIARKYREINQSRGYNGSVSSRDLYILRETLPPAVFIELGNIRNPQDQARWVVESNRDLVASWLAEGIMLDALK